MRKNDVNF